MVSKNNIIQINENPHKIHIEYENKVPRHLKYESYRKIIIILKKRKIICLPDILANGGGVVVSYFEWLQNKNKEK